MCHFFFLTFSHPLFSFIFDRLRLNEDLLRSHDEEQKAVRLDMTDDNDGYRGSRYGGGGSRDRDRGRDSRGNRGRGSDRSNKWGDGGGRRRGGDKRDSRRNTRNAAYRAVPSFPVRCGMCV